VADTEGRTATGCTPLKNQKRTMCVSVCCHTQRIKTEEKQRSVVMEVWLIDRVLVMNTDMIIIGAIASE